MTASPSIGVMLPSMSERGEPLADVAAAARHAEDVGIESVWAVDQLVAGTGVPFIDSTVALATAAAVTSRVRLGYGVMILPLRPAVWAAKQVASLQQVAGGRVLLGVGVGGDRHASSWTAAGVPRQERGRRTDAALAVLADLVAGRPTELDGATVELAPGVEVPPIIVGGGSDAALARVARHGDGWFTTPLPPADLVDSAARLRELAAAAGRPTPAITGSLVAVLDGDPAVPAPEQVRRRLVREDGMYGMPDAAVDRILVQGPPALVAERLAEHREVLGAERVTVSLVAGDWSRQTELLAEAAALLT